MDDAFVLHRVIRQFARWGVWAFFTRIHVIGGENVPIDGPMIVTATHHNMMLDPAVLSASQPNNRILHYWSKASLFANPVVKYILVSSGNIPVDRKSKDRMVLFKGTFETLARGRAVALFPEGTSYTEPRIMQIKDGAAWAALEYTRFAREDPKGKHSKEVVVVPAAIVYTNKSKYRSDVVVEYGKAITMDAYIDEFLAPGEGSARAAAKRLSRDIESALVKSTINAPDWDTLYAARMARDLLWPNEKSINLDDFVTISQTLVDLFATPDITSNSTSVKRRLLEYYSLLHSTGLTNSVLSSLPLPRTLDPSQPVPLPSRLSSLSLLLLSTLSLVIRIPFFLFPLLVHSPVYVMGRLGAGMVKDEEETQAQNKVVFGLLFMLFIYSSAFFFLWAFMWYTPMGALGAAAIVWGFAVYHNRLIGDNYERAKRLHAAWRVLVGVWAPKRWDISVSALSQYTTPVVPKASPWIQRSDTPPHPSQIQDEPAPSIVPSDKATSKPTGDKEGKKQKRRKPPSRKLIRHVLRARAEAVRALVSFFAQLERSPEQHGRITFLRNRGASIVGLEDSISIEGEWAADVLSSEFDSDAGVGSGRDEDLVWVPSSSSGKLD